MGVSGGTYYDLFALRPCDAPYYLKEHSFVLSNGLAGSLQVDARLDISTSSDDRLLKVRSCFGGFAIYRAEAILKTNCTYDVDETSCMCEHQPFMSCLYQRGFDGIYIDRTMVVQSMQ